MSDSQKRLCRLVPLKNRRLGRDAEEDRYNLYLAAESDYRIAAIFSRNRTTIRDWRYSRGLPTHRPRLDLTVLVTEAFRLLYEQGLSDSEIGRRLSRSRSTVRDWRHREGLPVHRKDGSGSVYLKKATSLDAISLEGGAELHELIPDEGWSNWLEEMGATIW